jgi:hypothetical protein
MKNKRQQVQDFPSDCKAKLDRFEKNFDSRSKKLFFDNFSENFVTFAQNFSLISSFLVWEFREIFVEFPDF